MQKIEPLDNESPLAFVERADALSVSDDDISFVLVHHFGFSEDGEIKKLKLQSKVFWEKYYLDHVRGILERGGARYAALKFVVKKNAFAEERRKLSQAEIDVLIDSVGEWNE